VGVNINRLRSVGCVLSRGFLMKVDSYQFLLKRILNTQRLLMERGAGFHEGKLLNDSVTKNNQTN
jgi:hypothetical protein